MEAALSEVPEDQLVPYTEGADYAAWSARCEAAAERWQAMRDEPDTWNPHLDRLGDGKAALEADMDRLGDLRGHDEAWAELYAMHGGIAERARTEARRRSICRNGTSLPTRRARSRRGPVFPRRQTGRRRWSWTTTTDTAKSTASSRAPRRTGRAGMHCGRRPRRGDSVSIIDLPGYAPLTEAERALRTVGEAMLADGGGPQLTRVPDGAKRAAAALEQLESHALLDRCVAAMDALKEAAGGAWASLPGDPPHKALEDAEELAKERGLEDAARRRLEAAIEEQAALLAQLAAIRQLLRDMEALDRHEQEFGESAARHEGLPRRPGSRLGGLAGRARSVPRGGPAAARGRRLRGVQAGPPRRCRRDPRGGGDCAGSPRPCCV